MEQEIIFKNDIDNLTEIKKHGNTPYCNPNMLEITPTVGCQFQCQYCNAYTQEKDNKFDKVIVYKNYAKYLDGYIQTHKEEVKNKFFYFSPKVDAFQDILITTGILQEILEVLYKHQARYFILTKGRLPASKTIQDLLIQSKNINQFIISCVMPNEDIRSRLEIAAPKIHERLELAKFATDNGIVTSAIFAPILPIGTLQFVKDYMAKYLELGITHFRVDFTEISRESLKKLVDLLPEYKKELETVYYDKDAVQTAWTIPFSSPPKNITRYWPSLKYMKNVCSELEKYATSIIEPPTTEVAGFLLR